MRLCFGGYLRQVRNRQDLVALTKLPELRPDRRRRLAADPRVYLVENVRRPLLDALLGEPYGKHDAAELPTRGVAPNSELRLSGVRPDHELHPLLARRP